MTLNVPTRPHTNPRKLNTRTDPAKTASTAPVAGESDRERLLDGRDGPARLRRHRLGFQQVWPRPSPDALSAFYQDEFYESESPDYLAKTEREAAFWDATWSLRRRLIESALPEDQRRILDIGASGGLLLDHFARHGWNVAGIEPSRSAVEWARSHFGFDLFRGELLDYVPHETGASSDPVRFDAIHSAQVFEHVLDPEACAARVAELLEPGGVAYIEVPNDFNAFQETARDDLQKPSWWVVPKLHLNYFDADSLSALLTDAGLVEIDRLASFPMELFLLMGDDYVGHPETGSACHARRMRFEETLVEAGRTDALLRFYRALGQASLGRTAGVLVRKPA